MNTKNYLLDALNEVLAWGMSDESFADAVIAQAGYRAGIDPEDIHIGGFCWD